MPSTKPMEHILNMLMSRRFPNQIHYKNAKIANKTTLIDKMNLALKQMHEDGTINKISSKYLD
jgi:ABC-type amino acid transport substrate-binding protein